MQLRISLLIILCMLSAKQRKVLHTPLNDINILSGVTGSGKSWVANLIFYKDMCTLKNTTMILTGNTSESLYKNVIKELLKMDQGIDWLKYTHSPSRIVVERTGNEIFCIGINNEGSEKRIKGGNVGRWYGDEVTTYPRSAYDMCLSRCRGEQDGKLIIMPALFTCNPDDELHYIKTMFIDPVRDDVNYWPFGFYDNPLITEKYINSMKANYAGVFYERMILGKWTGDPERKVLPEFTTEKEAEICIDWERPQYYDYYGALDPGFSHFTGYLVGYYDFAKGVYVIDGEVLLKKKNTTEIAEAVRKLEKATFQNKPIYLRVSDTELQVIADLAQLHSLQFVPTQKDNLAAQVNYVRILIQNNQLIINPKLVHLRRQMKTCIWNKHRTQWEESEGDGHYDLVAALIYLVRNINKQKNPYPAIPDGIQADTHHINYDMYNDNEGLEDLSRSILGG